MGKKKLTEFHCKKLLRIQPWSTFYFDRVRRLIGKSSGSILLTFVEDYHKEMTWKIINLQFWIKCCEILRKECTV